MSERLITLYEAHKSVNEAFKIAVEKEYPEILKLLTELIDYDIFKNAVKKLVQNQNINLLEILFKSCHSKTERSFILSELEANGAAEIYNKFLQYNAEIDF